MNTDQEKTKILIAPGTNYGHQFWDAFCHYGQNQFGYGYYVIAKTEYAYNQLVKHKKSNTEYLFAGVYDRFLAEYGKIQYEQDELLKTIRDFEKQSNCLVMDLIQADRNLGTGLYYTGGYRPDSLLKKRANYWDTLALINLYITYFSDMLEKVNPVLFLTEGAGSIETKLFHVVCKRKGIAIRNLSFARYENYYYWADDEMELIPHFEEYFNHFAVDESVMPVKVEGDMHSREVVLTIRFDLFSALQKMLTFMQQRIKQNIVYWVKKQQDIHYTYLFQSAWIWFIREWYMYKKLKKINQRQTITYKQKQYVFYPLHTEPESSLSVLAPEFNNQVAIIDLLSRLLPAGYHTKIS